MPSIGFATSAGSGDLKPIDDCYITVPGRDTFKARILPDISDSKGASYSDEPVIGRSFPIKTFGHGDNRTINMKWHFAITSLDVLNESLQALRAFQSCVYPRKGTSVNPYLPPVICTLSCKQVIPGDQGRTGVCAVLKSYNVSYPTDVVWDESTFLPLKFDIDLVWDVVYPTSKLPGADKIIS